MSASLAVAPSWTVHSTSAPLDPTDGPIVTGTPQIGPSLPKDVEPRHTDTAGRWEGIGEMPERLAPGPRSR